MYINGIAGSMRRCWYAPVLLHRTPLIREEFNQMWTRVSTPKRSPVRTALACAALLLAVSLSSCTMYPHGHYGHSWYGRPSYTTTRHTETHTPRVAPERPIRFPKPQLHLAPVDRLRHFGPVPPAPPRRK